MVAGLLFAMDDSDSIPRGSHGGILHARYRLVSRRGPVRGATITERFTVVRDPYNVGAGIMMGTIRTNQRGDFDDYVGFSTRQALPEDFELVADQEIRANGSVAALNQVTWSARRIVIRATDGRRPVTVVTPVQLR